MSDKIESCEYVNNIRENLRNLKQAVESEDWDDVSTFAEGIKEDAEELQEALSNETEKAPAPPVKRPPHPPVRSASRLQEQKELLGEQVFDELESIKSYLRGEEWKRAANERESLVESLAELVSIAQDLAKMTRVPEIPRELESLRGPIEAVVDAENGDSPARLEEALTELGERLMTLLRKK